MATRTTAYRQTKPLRERTLGELAGKTWNYAERGLWHLVSWLIITGILILGLKAIGVSSLPLD